MGLEQSPRGSKQLGRFPSLRATGKRRLFSLYIKRQVNLPNGVIGFSRCLCSGRGPPRRINDRLFPLYIKRRVNLPNGVIFFRRARVCAGRPVPGDRPEPWSGAEQSTRPAIYGRARPRFDSLRPPHLSQNAAGLIRLAEFSTLAPLYL